ncbi:hypothetical protein Ciccas_005728 [Cichlidogyrus casuarinus]|uniref:SWIM-type domain-containing protein n=1 Tax=Cichlidogyrus casuarinus TaxID=1844966 RepID=A0ABD2Q8W7_9PLAT
MQIFRTLETMGKANNAIESFWKSLKSKLLKRRFSMVIAEPIWALLTDLDISLYAKLVRLSQGIASSKIYCTLKRGAATITDFSKISAKTFSLLHKNGTRYIVNSGERSCNCEEIGFCSHMFRLFEDGVFSPTLFDPLIEISRLEENFKNFQTIKYVEKNKPTIVEKQEPITIAGYTDQEVKDIIELLSNIPAAEAKTRLKCPQRTGKMIPVHKKKLRKSALNPK